MQGLILFAKLIIHLEKNCHKNPKNAESDENYIHILKLKIIDCKLHAIMKDLGEAGTKQYATKSCDISP